MKALNLHLCGIAATLVYAAIVVLGGILWPDYNRHAQPASDPTATAAPDGHLVDPPFTFGLFACVSRDTENTGFLRWLFANSLRLLSVGCAREGSKWREVAL